MEVKINQRNNDVALGEKIMQAIVPQKIGAEFQDSNDPDYIYRWEETADGNKWVKYKIIITYEKVENGNKSE